MLQKSEILFGGIYIISPVKFKGITIYCEGGILTEHTKYMCKDDILHDYLIISPISGLPNIQIPTELFIKCADFAGSPDKAIPVFPVLEPVKKRKSIMDLLAEKPVQKPFTMQGNNTVQ